MPVGSQLAHKYWISLDPGLEGTGWAIWLGDQFKESGVIKPHGKTWEEKLRYVIGDLKHDLDDRVCMLYYELPFIALDGVAGISAKKQDVIKLTMLAGAITTLFQESYPVPVIRWKGNMPKKLSMDRVKAWMSKNGYSFATKTSHENDAIGIGLYVIKVGGKIPC